MNNVECQKSVKLLCCFIHRWLDFRIAEIESLASLYANSSNDSNKKITWELPQGTKSPLSPIYFITLPSYTLAQNIAKRALLLKCFLELWGEGNTWNVLKASIENCPLNLKVPYYNENVSFKVIVDTWGVKSSQEDKVKIIEKLDFLPFKGKVDLENPDVIYWLIIIDPDHQNLGLPNNIASGYYFGRQIARSNRTLLKHYTLPKRSYLGPTSMDAEMAFIMCNQAKVKSHSLVYDPFVGTGSILVAASHHGAHTFGTDIDYKILKQTKFDKKGNPCDIWTNFDNYNISRPIGLVLADIHYLPFKSEPLEMFDAIICDPPYGIRAGGKKLSSNDIYNDDDDSEDPSSKKSYYTVGQICRDLLDLSAKMLRISGRLVYFFPSTQETYDPKDVPSHPMLKCLFNSEQFISTKYSRRLITMEKIREYDGGVVREFHKAQGRPILPIDNIHDIVFEKKRDKDKIYYPKGRGKTL